MILLKKTTSVGCWMRVTLHRDARPRSRPIKLGGEKKVNRTDVVVVVVVVAAVVLIKALPVLVPLFLPSFLLLPLPAHLAPRRAAPIDLAVPSFLPSSRKRRKCPVVPNWPLSLSFSLSSFFSCLTISLKCQGLESQDSGLLRPSFVLSPPSFVTLFSHFSPRGI